MSAAPAIGKLKSLLIEATNGPLKGKHFSLTKPLVTIGRGSDNDIVLEKDLKVSRHHVEIRQVNGLVSMQNMNMQNSMMVNGQLVSFFPMNNSHCILRIGDSEFHIQVEGANAQFQKALPSPKSSLLPQRSGDQQVVHLHAAVPAHLHAAPVPPAARPPYAQAYNSAGDREQSKTLFYAIIGVVFVFGVWLMKGGASKKVVEELRRSDDVESDIFATQENIKKLEAENKKQVTENPAMTTAQHYYLKGFRDYQHAQYGRAITNFQTAITFQPQHELARKYFGLARRKLDEQIKHEMISGMKYKGQGHYRMCSSSYKKALSMMLDQKDPAYAEAKQYETECNLMQKEKY